jgi:(2Fe-2S) ferredoxin
VAKHKITVCTKGKTCRKRGAREIYCALEQQIEALGLEKQIKLKKSDCLGRCGRAPTVRVKPHKVFYGSVSSSDCSDIISSLISNSILDRLRLKKG